VNLGALLPVDCQYTLPVFFLSSSSSSFPHVWVLTRTSSPSHCPLRWLSVQAVCTSLLETFSQRLQRTASHTPWHHR
jgi:hypothetical protein